jgi:diguanylate cyclase (GGDEF)-like protein
VNLLQTLVEQGVMPREKAQALVQQAQEKAATDAAAAAAADEGAVRVTYVPQTVRDEISRQVAEDVRPQLVDDVVARAKQERWGVPAALPDWLARVRWSGDVRVRAESDLYADGNLPQTRLDFLAHHDVLTELPNRLLFGDRLHHAIERARRDGLAVALLFIDLDHFKNINDSLGHQVGDQLLVEVANRLRGLVRQSDTLARLGGDEFGVLLEDCTLEMAQRIGEELRHAIRDFRFSWQDRVMNVGVSIGLAEMSGECDTLSTIMSAADVACYSAKESGRNRVHTYTEGRAPERHREMQWVSRINRACEEERFELYFQPIVPIRHGVEALRQFELLLRMRDENGQLVQPNEFIPAAERFNLMARIDRWVVRQACRSLAHRRSTEESILPYCLTINVSTTTINDEQFLDYVIAEMAAAEVSPGALCFELTETTAMTSLAAATHFIRQLRKRGVRFSLDDFGSGLSSFMFLKNLPVDYVKIDGQFVHNVAQDAIDRSMVEAITQIAGTMGIATIAERVDSAEVLEQLAIIGVQYAQGHYVASPQPVAVMQSILSASPLPWAGEVDRQVG